MSNLLVQNIKHTNGTTAQTIDSSGRVSTPVKPSFFVTGHQSSTTTFTTGGESATVNGVTPSNCTLMYNYHNVHHNVGSHFNNASGRFTCPVAGLYLVTGHNGHKDSVDYFGLGLFCTSSDSTTYGHVISWSHNNAVNAGHTVVAHVNASVGQQFLMFYPTGLATPSNTSSEASYSSFGVTFLG